MSRPEIESWIGEPRSPAAAKRLLGGLAVLLLAALVAAPAGAQPAPEVLFTDPPDGSVVEAEPLVRVTGRARGVPPAARTLLDVMIVVDTSGSTAQESGVVLDREGRMVSSAEQRRWRWFGRVATVLEAEVAAAARFLDVSDPGRTRVGVITFAGAFQTFTGWGVPGSVNARVEQPLTTDYDAVRSALHRVARRGSMGGTDMAAGLRLAVVELMALEGARSAPRPEARKVVLLMTDGLPTLPVGSVNAMDPGDVEAVLGAARLAARAGIVIHTFCLGPEALGTPIACVEAARLTGGLYNPVERPGEIVDVLPATPVGQVELVAVRNATTGQMARSLTLAADGVFTAEVVLAPGANRIVAELHGARGLEASAAVVVHYRAREVEVQVTRERRRELDVQVERPGERRLDVRIERPGPPR